MCPAPARQLSKEETKSPCSLPVQMPRIEMDLSQDADEIGMVIRS